MRASEIYICFRGSHYYHRKQVWLQVQILEKAVGISHSANITKESYVSSYWYGSQSIRRKTLN